MNKAHELIRKTEKVLRDNSPVILTALGASGVVSTAYFSWQAGYQTAQRLGEQDPYESFREKSRRVWRLHIPAVISGSLAIASIVGSSRVSARRTAALSALYSVTEATFTEYRERVIAKFGEGKEQQLRDELAQDQINRKPPPAGVLMVGPGNVLCCELYTKRYFNCDMETLKQAQNEVNATINQMGLGTLSDFYDLIGLDNTAVSDHFGWTVDKLMKLEFSTVLSPDGRPCIAFNYNYIKPV